MPFAVETTARGPKWVRKRKGTRERFEARKIEKAIVGAFRDASNGKQIGRKIDAKRLSQGVVRAIGPGGVVEVDKIQDMVETVLMEAGLHQEAKAYILWRDERDRKRKVRKVMPPEAIADFITVSKYSRFREELQRREVYPETVVRTRDMHLRRYPQIADEINWAFGQVLEKRNLPSMRALEDSTLIRTREGWKTAGEIVEGDVLYSSSGQETSVKGVVRFQDKPLFRLTFSDDTQITACAEHLWIVSTRDDYRKETTRVVDTIFIKEHLKQAGRNNIFIWNPAPIQRDEADLGVDPYVLGHWLGDGYSTGYQYSVSTEDAEFVGKQYEAAGYAVRHSESSNIWTYSVRGLCKSLREYGLVNNKHIPRAYLDASVEQRLSLLQGLMDSDGHVRKDGRCYFFNTNPALIEGVKELLSSLGVKYIVSMIEDDEDGDQTLYTVNFFTSLRVARLPRKANSLRALDSKRTQHRTVKSVEPVGTGCASCFHVDSEDHSFLAGERMVVTHNSMQFGGAAIEKHHNRLYNCSVSPCDRPRFFQEIFFLSLCGSGAGFSVQRHHVAKIPPIAKIDRHDVRHHIVEDDIEGWANALGALIQGYLKGYYVEFAYHKVRPWGDPLKTSGGKAPGHLPLKESLEKVREILDSCQGRHLKPIEAHDIVCIAVSAVLSGGIRRSALISLFSFDDEEMMSAKTGKWFETAPWRRNANNSVVLLRDRVSIENFDTIFRYTKEFGEPGIYFTDDPEVLCNPCGEIASLPVLTVEEEHLELLCREPAYQAVQVGDRISGWQMCNLSEINAAMFETAEDMMEAARAAAIIGTCQAGYTDFDYLGPVSEIITRRDALLGVSMTGMVDSPELSFDAEFQRRAAEVVVETNREIADKIGIRPAARATCVKPAGKTSLVLGCVGSGIHAHPSRRYFRRVIAQPLDPVYQHFRATNPHMCETINEREDIVTFCVEAPENAITLRHQSALDALELVLLTLNNWIAPGTADQSSGLRHNVSNTIHVRSDEWGRVRDFLWEHRHEMSGVAMLAYDGDKVWANAPRQPVRTEADEQTWSYLVSNYQPVDYALMREFEDTTTFQMEAACSAGTCDLEF